MIHEMDIKHIILMNQHLNLQINVHYHLVEPVDYKFPMPNKREKDLIFKKKI